MKKKRKKTPRERQENRQMMLCGALFGGLIFSFVADWPELSILLYIGLVAVAILEGGREP